MLIGQIWTIPRPASPGQQHHRQQQVCSKMLGPSPSARPRRRPASRLPKHLLRALPLRPSSLQQQHQQLLPRPHLKQLQQEHSH